MQESHRFPKSEKLCGLTTIGRVFTEGSRIKQFPFKCVWIRANGDTGVRIMFSVPKKHFRHAVDRNRVKRLLRESYRLHNAEFKAACVALGLSVDIAVVYNNGEMPDYAETEKRMELLLAKLKSAVEESSAKC